MDIATLKPGWGSDSARAPTLTLVKPPLRVPRASYSTLRCPPIGLAYLGAAAREAGYTVNVVDAVGEDLARMRPLPGGRFVRVGLSDEEILARIPADTDVIGVTCGFSEEWPLYRRVFETIRRARPRALIVAGGEHISAAAELSMRTCPAIDLCAHGEGEETLIELLAAVRSGAALDGVPGLSWLEGERYVKTAPRARIRAVDSIPWPAWDLIPLRNYLDGGHGFGIGRGRSVPILATRGCPYQCTFCSSPTMWTTRWSARDPNDVLDEMGWAIDTYGAGNFDFYDLTLVVRKDWLREFCHRLIERNYNVTWQVPSGTRSEALDAEVLPLMRRAGCSYLPYAPESGSPAVLERIKKKVDLDNMKASMRAAVEAGISVKCNMIIGFPGETREDVRETIRFCWDLAEIGVHDVNMGPFVPYPGSELFEELTKSGKLQEIDDDYFDMLANYSDLGNSQSWSEHMDDRVMHTARFAAMATFYARSFARRPGRLLSLARNVRSGRHQTRLDRAVADLMVRWSVVGREQLSRLVAREQRDA